MNRRSNLKLLFLSLFGWAFGKAPLAAGTSQAHRYIAVWSGWSRWERELADEDTYGTYHGDAWYGRWAFHPLTPADRVDLSDDGSDKCHWQQWANAPLGESKEVAKRDAYNHATEQLRSRGVHIVGYRRNPNEDL